MSQTQKFDASIPMLTEVLWDAAEQAPAAHGGQGADQRAAPTPAAPAGDNAAPGAGPARDTPSLYSAAPKAAPLYATMPETTSLYSSAPDAAPLYSSAPAPLYSSAPDSAPSYSSAPETAPSQGTPAGNPDYSMQAPTRPAGMAPHASPASAYKSEQQWNALERRLSQRILQQVQGSLDDIVAQCVTDVLQGALLHLTGELHRGLQDSVEQIVAQAISAERAQLRDLPK